MFPHLPAPIDSYNILFLQLFLPFQSSSINPFSPISPLIPSAQVSLGLPRFLLPGGRHILRNYLSVLRFLSYLIVTMNRSSGPIDLRKFVFCFLIDVSINSKIYLNVFELVLKYLQNLSSSLSKSSRRL
jgi:hypothetical protein